VNSGRSFPRQPPWLLFAALALLSSAAAAAAAPRPLVLVAPYSGIISPASREYLVDAMETAERRGAAALVIELDTPGGLDASMREIVRRELSSTVPVVVYVHPAGARAASAGVFITMAADVAAMTPGTNIGAAHPVEIAPESGALLKTAEKKGKPDVLEEKITNDAMAYLRAIAAKRGRNARWARFVVAQSTSVTAGEALNLGVIDLVADDLSALLKAVDGRRFSGRSKPLDLNNRQIVFLEMSPRQRALAALSDPNVAAILMTLGVTGLMIELYSPGLIFPGIVGAACLIMGFYSFEVFSAGHAGGLLVLLGLFLFLLELKIPSYGLLTAGGISSIAAGGLLLLRTAPGGPRPVPAGFVMALLLLAGIAGAALLFARRALARRSVAGTEGLIGAAGETVTALSPEGRVIAQGEAWSARSLDGDIPAGEPVEVVSVEGLTLGVRRRPSSKR
jgi:membrane-bound serine protease (ClpP class)